jgi:signal transduction histidine kinase
MRKRTLYFLLFLILPRFVFSQVSKYSGSQYSTVNGLPNNLVTDIGWDSTGFMWICTFNGIARFDGAWIEAFTNNNYPILKGEYTSGLSTNEKGQTIFADENGNIYSLRKNKPALIDSLVDKNDRYRATSVLGLSSRIQQKIIEGNIDFKGNEKEMVQIDDSSCFLAKNNKLHQFNAATGKVELIKEFPGKIQVFKINERIFLCEKDKQFYEIKAGLRGKDIAITPIDYPFSLEGTEIFWRNGTSNPILLQEENSYLLSVNNNRICRELVCDQVPDNISITCMRYDRKSGVMAIGSDGNGVFIFKRKVLDSYTNSSADILSLARVYNSQVEVEPGKLWLPYKSELDFTTRKLQSNPRIPDFKSALKVKDSLVLFNCADGFISSYDLKTKKISKRFNSRSDGSSAFVVTEDRIFHGGDYGFTEITPKGDSLFFAFRDSVKRSNTFRDMFEYRPGYLVFSGCYGAFGFDIHTLQMDTFAITDAETCFYQTAIYHDYLLIATGDGIRVYKDKVVRRVPLDDKDIHISANNIYVDHEDNVWIGANAGIFIAKAKDIVRKFLDGAYELNFKFLGKNYGLDLSELNGGWQGSVQLLSNGKLSYAGVNGIATISPAEGTKEQNFPVLFYDDIVMNDSVHFEAGKKNLLFPSAAKKVRIYFSILNWRDATNTTLEYRIKDISQSWIPVDFFKQNYVDLINLPAGQHHIEFNLQQGLEKLQSNLAFSIETSWYRTRIFYLLMALLGIVIIAGFIYWRLYYLRKKNESLSEKITAQVRQIGEQKRSLQTHIEEMKKYHEKLEKDYALKNRLISLIGHDIVTPLRFMNRAGLILAESRDQISEATYDDTIRTMLETSNNLHDMAVNMLSWIRHHQGTMKFIPSLFDFSKTFETIVNSIRPLAGKKQLTVMSKSVQEITIYQFQDAIKTILLQLLNNAVKYSEKGTITAEVDTADQNIVVTINDEGIGMPADTVLHLLNTDKITDFTTAHDNKGHGFGFLIVKDMIRIVKGSIKIESVINEGTRIIVSFPEKITINQN